MTFDTAIAATRRWTLAGFAATATAAMFGTVHHAVAQIRRPQIAVVAKVADSPWFDAMEAGITKAAQEHNVDAWMVRPVDPDPVYQVRAAEDLIEQKVEVLAVVPNDAAELAPVFARARAAGIRVITHESPGQNGNDWDIELTTIEMQSEATVDALAFNMGGAGKYIIIVGSLVVPLHNAWADASIAAQKAKYPDMNAVPERFGVGENRYDSYKTVLDQIRAHPDLKGILAYGSQGPIGAARALDERGKGKQIRPGRHFPATTGRPVPQDRHDSRRLSVEPHPRRPDDRTYLRNAGERRAAGRRNGAAGSRPGASVSGKATDSGFQDGDGKQAHHRPSDRGGPVGR